MKKYELFMRETNLMDEYNVKATSQDDVYEFATKELLMDAMDRECVVVLATDTKLNVIGYNIVSVGTLTESQFCQREVMKFLILVNASGAILMHNHPSGDPSPSVSDIEVTKVMSDACKIMGIHMIDHLVIGRNRYESLRSYIQ